MKKYINKIFLGSALILGLGACSDDFLDINTDPNVAQEGDIDLLLPAAQASMTGHIWGLDDAGSIFTQQAYILGPSTYNITNVTYQSQWEDLYSESLKDLQGIVEVGTEREAWIHVGMAQIMQGLIYHNLVDYFGDIPYTDALQGETIINPSFDSGASVYTGVLALLDEAIANLEKDVTIEVADGADVFYDGDTDSWIAAANTIKLKMNLNLAKVDASSAATAINAIVTDGRLVGFNGVGDFEFTFGSNLNPLNRHPGYNNNYDGTPNYVSNYIMLQMALNSDPRIRHYFYRQSTYGELEFDTTPCSNRAAGDCQMWEQLFALGLDYMGRDQGDNGGIPGDNDLRTAIGLYPIGGRFDDSSYGSTTLTAGALGAGVKPYFTAADVNFMLAEAALTVAGVSTPSTADVYFADGMTAAFAKVRSFALASTEASSVTAWETANAFDWDAAVTAYMADRTAEYNSGAPNAEIEAVMTQRYFADFGNGTEVYTSFRRTGYPSNLPDAITAVGPFPVRLPYPTSELAANSNAPAEVRVDVPVFWDAN